MKNSFTPSIQMIKAAEMLFAAMAYEQTIKPIVIGYQTKILEKHQFLNHRELKLGLPQIEKLIVLNPDKVYLLSDNDFKIYWADCLIEQQKAKLITDSPEQCPLLVAQNLVTKAEHHFIEVMANFTKISLDMATYNLDNYKKIVDLNSKLIAPYVSKEKTF